MKSPRRLAWAALVLALAAVIAAGAWQALHHREHRPPGADATEGGP